MSFSNHQVNNKTSQIDRKLLPLQWNAKWIIHPMAKSQEYGVYHFRKCFYLSDIPTSFLVNVSADNRYSLFVNGINICCGPARGDISNWYYETLNLTPFLIDGNNTIAAIVWNAGTLAPLAQISHGTAFILQGNTTYEEVVNTDSSWKVLINNSYKPCSLNTSNRLDAYMAIGPGDHVEGSQYPWDWEKPDFNDDFWENAKEIGFARSTESTTPWNLTPRNIPLFHEEQLRFQIIRRTNGIKLTQNLLTGKAPLLIPPHQSVDLLLDHSFYTVAYPELIISGGNGSLIQMTYAEALFDDNGVKRNRNDIETKEIVGNYDRFNPDDGENRKFRPLWFRAYRYLQINIITNDQPLIINDIYSMTTGYPLKMNASFSSNDETLQDIWEVGWRTAKLCAGELFYDTPYFEQLQYTGDSRIQALISLYVSGDDRLVRKAILEFHHSKLPEGLTQSRYPSSRQQIIPTFSLFWISMVYDYWMHRKDDIFIKQFLPTIKDILNWFNTHIDQKKKILGPLHWWNFVDWDNFNDRGTAPGSVEGNSSIVSLQYAYTLNQAAEILHAFDQITRANEYRISSREIYQNTFKTCYNREKGLIADTPEQSTYSQHAGIWAILSGSMLMPEMKEMMHKLLSDKTIGQVTLFYRFYLTQALKKAEMADLYYSELTPWRDMLKLGLTTFAEKSEPTRSDCHAWSASPSYDFLATICGIMPAKPGFQEVLIKPALGELTEVEGSMPHPKGEIIVKLKRQGNNGISADITLSGHVKGTFSWKQREIELQSGAQYITIID